MTDVEVRLQSADQAAMDTVETALRTVLDIPAPAREYGNRPNHRGRGRTVGEQPNPERRRFMHAAATKPAAVQAAAAAGGQDPPHPSPLDAATDAKQRRDLAGEIGALMSADADLTARPWYPIQPGDVILMHMSTGSHGETYLAVTDPDGFTDPGGNPPLRLISQTRADWHAEEEAAGRDPLDRDPGDFYSLWFEAGPDLLTVIRAGTVIHGHPQHAGTPTAARK